MKNAQDIAWIVFGVIYAWIVAMSVVQRGVGGYLLAYVGMFAVVLILLIFPPLARIIWSNFGLVIAPVVLACWIWLAGSYSYQRDLAMSILAALGTVLAFPRCREALAQLWRRLKGETPAVLSSQGWVGVATVWLLASWTLISIADRIGEAGPLERRGNVVSPTNMPTEWKSLRVGLALSGGGYRAAVMHAGVLDQLGELGVPITNLSTVSGGSIIGGFVSAGGSPGDFLEAVKKGRFRYTRDLTWPWNLLRLLSPAHVPWLDVDLWPFGSFSRLDVQRELIDRVLLAGVRADAKLPGPEIVINSTDLRYGLSVGLTREGMFLFGIVANERIQEVHEGRLTRRSDLPPFFYSTLGMVDLTTLAGMAQRVALSGAFPGAFPVTEFNVTIPIGFGALSGGATRTLSLALADGGIRDNLGFNVLDLASVALRLPTDDSQAQLGASPSSDWRLDMVLVSDGGKAIQSADKLSTLDGIFRAIDLSGLETGSLRRFWIGGKPAFELLSNISSLSFSPDQIVYGYTTDQLRDDPGIFLSRQLVDDETLLSVLDLGPARSKALELAAKFKSLNDPAILPQGERARQCQEQESSGHASRDCVRFVIERLVGADLWRVLTTFRQMATLEDNFSSHEVDDIFRLGRYLVRLKWKSIQDKLNAAAVAK